MYIFHVSTDKRDKCNIMVFPHSATCTYRKRKVIGFLEKSLVVCRLHETAFQTTKTFIFTSMKIKYLTQKWNEFDFHDETNGFMVYCHIRQGTQKARGNGSCLGPHMNIYDFHRCLFPSRNPVGNSCNLRAMGPNNYVFWNNNEDSASHKLGIAPTDKIHWIASSAILHSTGV